MQHRQLFIRFNAVVIFISYCREKMSVPRGISIIFILVLIVHAAHCQDNSTNSSSNTTETLAPPVEYNPNNSTNSSNPEYPPPINSTNTTNSTSPPEVDNGTINGTNSTNGTAPPPMNGTNTTNSTNGTAPPPVNNQTNHTTTPYQNFTTNSTEALQNSGIDISGSLTLAPPPPITSEIITTLYQSPNENRFLGSKQVQCLRITQAGNTTFTLDRFNRSSSNFINSYSLVQAGLWQFVASSADELTCSMVFNPSTSTYAFLFFDEATASLTIKARILLSNFPSPLTTLPVSNMSAVEVGDGCDLLRYGSQIYSIGNTSLSLISGSVTVRASTSNLRYAVANNSLFRYSASLNSYTNIMTLNTIYSNFGIENFDNRIVLWGSNSQPSGGKFDVNQTLFVVVDKGTSIAVLKQEQIISYQNPGNTVPVQVSPQLTKVHFEYLSNPSNLTVSVFFFDINYDDAVSTKLSLGTSPSYPNTVRFMPSFEPNNYFLGDYYLVIRNESAINATANASSVAGENTFQFMGERMIPLRYRELPEAEISNACYKTIIDADNLDELVVLDLYPNNDASNPGYSIYEFSYGNLASTIRVIPPLPDAYLTFDYPTHTAVNNNPVPDRFQWDFLNVGTDTDYSSYLENQNLSNHLQIDHFPLTGVWEILASSSNCRLMKSASNYNIHVFGNNGTALAIMQTYDVSATLSGGASNWAISADCQKVRGDTNYYAIVGGALTAVSGSPSIISTDALMKYAVSASDILRYNSSTNTYDSFYSNVNVTFSASAKIVSFNSSVVVTDTTASSADVYAFVDSAGSAREAFRFSSDSLVNYTTTPIVLVSPELTKVLVYGIANGTFDARFYHINYNTLASASIDFPADCVFDPNRIHFALEEKWLYVRQLSSSNRPAGQNQQIAYGIVFDTIVVQVDRKIITSSDETNCNKYLTKVVDNGDLYVLAQCNTNSTRPVVELWQVLASQASGGAPTEDLGVTQTVIDGQVKLCPPGCSDCSTGVCTSCTEGYVHDPNSFSCFMCPAGCTKCLASNPNSCSACLDGSYISGTECLPCDPACITCVGTASSCMSCLPGQYFNISTASCQPCSRNCLNCTSSITCDDCRKGFVVTINGTCRKCSQKCSSCEPSDITKCTSCNKYLQLVAGSCEPCPARCQRCSGNICARCDSGYRPGDDGSCVERCVLPCKTCRDDNPNHCRSCFYGSFLNGSTCSLDLSCNLGNNCTDCGQGTGFVLVGANCLRCSNIPNCKQCRQTNTKACAICQSGYYINGARCTACSLICSTCISQRICTSCVPGFTIPNSAPQGRCISCESPCLTCSGSTTYCTSCVSGFTKKNWMCQNNINVGFSFTIVTNDTAAVLNFVDDLVTFLLNAMRINPDRVDVITFSSIRLGSVTIDGTADPSAGGGTTSAAATTAASASLAGALSSGASIGTFTVGTSSVVTNGVSTQEESSKLGLIIGLSVGIPIAVISLVIIIYVVYKRSKVEEDQEEEPQEKEKQSMEHIQNAVRKEDMAIMELELADMDSVSKNTNQQDRQKEEDEGFSEYLQANPNPIMEPEIISDELENYSPTPIITVNKDFEVVQTKQQTHRPPPLTNQIHQPSVIKKIPPPPKANLEPVIHVQPIRSEQLPQPEEDEFGEFVQEKPKKEEPVKVKNQLVFEDDFGEYQYAGNVAAAPVAELELPDEDEFGVIPEENPSKVGLYSQTQPVTANVEKKESLPKGPAPLVSGMFQLQIDGQSESQPERKEEAESEGSRY